MLSWLAAEFLVAVVILLITCRLRWYWLGAVLIYLLWPLFCRLAPLQPVQMFALPYVLGLPLMALLSKVLPSNARANLRGEHVAASGRDRDMMRLCVGLFVLTVLLFLSSWEVYDLANGRISVECRTWWGLVSRRQEWPLNRIGEVKAELRPARVEGASPSYVDLVILGKDGKKLFRSATSVLFADAYAQCMNDALKDPELGFRGSTVVDHWVLPLFALVLAWYYASGRGSRSKWRDGTRTNSSTPRGISLADVLMQTSGR